MSWVKGQMDWQERRLLHHSVHAGIDWVHVSYTVRYCHWVYVKLLTSAYTDWDEVKVQQDWMYLSKEATQLMVCFKMQPLVVVLLYSVLAEAPGPSASDSYLTLKDKIHKVCWS